MKTQISLGICPDRSESSLCTEWMAKDPSFLHADSEDSERTGQIWVFAGRTCHFVGFVIEVAQMVSIGACKFAVINVVKMGKSLGM